MTTAWGCLAVNCSYSKSRVEALGGFALSESSWEEGKCHNHDTRHSPVMCRACTAFQHSRRALLTLCQPQHCWEPRPRVWGLLGALHLHFPLAG